MEQIAVSIAEAARTIGIGRTKIYELINEGELSRLKVGRRTLVTVHSISGLVERSA